MQPRKATRQHVLFMRRRQGQCSSILNFGAPVDRLIVCGKPVPRGSAYQFCEDHLRVYAAQYGRRL